MEKLWTNAERVTTYPSRETMELFLQIWKKLNLFEEEISKKNNVNIYSNVPAVHALAILIEKIQTQGNEQLKEEFQNVLKTDDTDKIYRFIANSILDIWLEKHNNDFVRETVKSDKQRFEKITNFSRDDISPIPYSYLPNRYWDSSSTNIIHEKFELELARLNWIQEWADQIQQESSKHTFERWDNWADISALKEQL